MLAQLFLMAQPPLGPGFGENMTAQELFVMMSITFLMFFMLAVVLKMFNVPFGDYNPDVKQYWPFWLFPVLSVACLFMAFLLN